MKIEYFATHDYENDTKMTYSTDVQGTHLELHFHSEDPDCGINGIEELHYNAGEELSPKAIGLELLEEISAYLDGEHGDPYYDEHTRTALYAFENILKIMFGNEEEQKMHKYEITVTETSSCTYIVEALNEKAAMNLFSEWSENNSESIANDLEKGFNGWDFGMPEKIHSDCIADLSYDELMKETKQDINDMVKRQMLTYGIPTDSQIMIDKITDLVMERPDFKEKRLWTSDDVDIAIKTMLANIVTNIDSIK